MNGLSTAAPHPPPPRSSSTTLITSLTSRSKSKQCGATGTATTSLAEALATSVADLVCDLDHRKLINGSTAAAAAEGTKLGLKLTQHHTPVTTAANTEIQSATSSTQSTMDTSSSSQPSPPATSAPRSSMSSAVADLASGMSVFQPANINAATTTSTPIASNSSLQNNAQHRNYHFSTKTISSAPIISGTAAAVLALQSASSLHDNHSNYYDNIVSSNSVRGSIVKRIFATEDSDDTAAVVENNSSCAAQHVPNPLLTTSASPHSPSGGDGVVIRHVSSPTINTTASNCSSGSNSNFHSPSSHNNSSTTGVWTLPKFPTRYSDGAPIIAGTAAAAQMEASIATAARITSLSAGSHEEDCGGIIHAVASLGPCGVVVGGGSCHSHGFSSPGEGAGGAAIETEYHYWNGSTTAGPLTITTQGSKALSWVDHRANNYLRVTPEDGSSTAGGYSFHSSPAHPVALVSSSQHCTTSIDHGSHTTGGGGGMDMLAEITCHAPPMILPTDLSQDSTTTFNATSYLPQNAEIISDQETCYHASSPQASAAQHSQIHDQQRVSIIPSYQEIYREMGIPHQHSYNQRQPQHHSAHHYSTSSYSVEEIEVDACHISHASDHQHQQQLSHGDCTDPNMCQLHSRTPTLHFGQVNRDDIEEGKELYTRTDLYQFGGHVSESKDVHGNMKDGCDSIVIGNLEKDLRECDGLLWFLFSTDRTNGGGALCQSYHKKRPIRVFRSSLLGGKYAPPFLDVEDDEEEDSDVAYRYDGLYMVRAVWDIQGQETESHPVCGENGWQTYFFTRLPKRPLEKEKWEGGMEYNAMGCQELWSTIQKMRGVRKPKKFEIPPPPVKLGQMKKCAITGQWKERKRAGYVKPVAEMDVAPPKQVSKSKRVEDIDSSEFKRRDDGYVDDSDSDCSQEHQHHTPSHDQSPSKVLTPRPRLNSIPDKKASPTNHHHDADSSDSESITSDVRFNSNIDRRKSTPSSANNGESSNNVDVSMFFPKRASAARAEAANRDMFGGSRSYKRKSSESAVAASYQPARSGAGRKRTKIRHHDDSSSSEEEQSPDLVDSSILTIGSRVLVSYKGQLFKATIRKRREKAGADDFLIHYDGNKKSNVHWIGSDRIDKILEINVDTPPQRNNSMASQRNKRTNGETKKSLQNQESIESSQSDDVRDEEMSEAEEEKIDSHCKRKDEESVSESQNHDAQGEKSEVPLNKERNVDMQNQSRKADSGAGDSEVSEIKECKPDNETVKGATVESQPESPVLESGASINVEEMESETDLEQASSNIQTAKSPKAAPKKKRETTVTDVCFATAPRPSRNIESSVHSDAPNRDTTLAEAESNSVDEANGKESDENSISSSDNPPEKHASSVKTGKYKYSEGDHVYVEYRNILYSSTILKSRKKRSTSEYLVHYEGYKKSSNTWVKESALHEVNAATTQRFEVQRLIHCDSFNQSNQASDFQEVTKRRAASDSDPPPSDSSSHSVALKKPPPRRTRSDASDLTLGTLDSGVAFLAGSMVFVEWTGALYLAKMLKKRYSGEHMEYLISYDGYKSNHDAWVSVQKIYEVNPQTKRVFKKLCSDLAASNAGKQKRPSPPGPKQRETRRKSDEVEDEASARGNGKSTPSLTRVLSQSSRTSTSSINTHMQGIETGVEFLPGSTLFAVYKDGLCLAKMLKKRGKGEYTEYLVQYNGLKKVEEAWVSTGLVYEINPQTKRMFRKLSVTK